MPEEVPRRGEQTRNDIVSAAYELFIQQGYHGTTMRQIAKNAGIALGGLYNHFASKEAVFREVLITYHPYHEVLPAMIHADGDSIEEYMSQAIVNLMQGLTQRPDLLNLLFIELVELKSAHIAEVFNKLMPQVSLILEKIQQLDDGRLRPIPPLLMMRIFLSVFIGYYLSEVAFRSHLPPEFGEGGLEHFIDVLMHGLVTTEG